MYKHKFKDNVHVNYYIKPSYSDNHSHVYDDLTSIDEKLKEIIKYYKNNSDDRAVFNNVGLWIELIGQKCYESRDIQCFFTFHSIARFIERNNNIDIMNVMKDMGKRMAFIHLFTKVDPDAKGILLKSETITFRMFGECYVCAVENETLTLLTFYKNDNKKVDFDISHMIDNC